MDSKITDLAAIFTGYQSRKAVEHEAVGTHRLLQIRDFDQERSWVNLDRMIRFSPAISGGDKLLEQGDVVFLGRGQKNFAFALPQIPEPTLAGSYFFVLRPQRMITGPFLAWYLNQSVAQRHIKRLSTVGAHMPVVTRDMLESLKVPTPDLETQRKIIELDALATRQTELLVELADKKRALATEAAIHAANS
jgi:hypothetical protein